MFRVKVDRKGIILESNTITILLLKLYNVFVCNSNVPPTIFTHFIEFIRGKHSMRFFYIKNDKILFTYLRVSN